MSELVKENERLNNSALNEQPLGNNPKKLKKKKKITVGNVLIYGFLGLFSLFCLFPLMYIFLLSFSTETDWMNSSFLVVPMHFHFENYRANLLAGYIPQAFLNSILLVVFKTLFQMALTSLAAYSFTRKEVPGIRVIFTIFLIPMFFGGGLLPFYLTVRATTGLNNLAAIIIPFGLNGFNMIVLRNFFSAVPESLIESCKLDGASDLRILCQFILPLSKAGLATITLFYMVGTWNEWYWPSILLTDIELYPLALLVRQSLNPGELPADRWKGDYNTAKTYGEGLNAAMTVIALVPILAVYPVLQKYFTRGVMIGSVKG